MNSPVLEDGRERIRFEHPDQWRCRPGWRERIDITEHNLADIIGGYDLPKDLYQHCGLCDRVHGKGYIVVTVDQLETQIGHECGATKLGAVFTEMERTFQLAVKAQDRRKRLQDLLAQKASLLADAKRAIDDCDRAAAAVAAIQHQISREPTLEYVYRKALSADGSVYVERRASNEQFERTRQRFTREVVGRIDGHGAAAAKSPKGLIQIRVLPLAHSLSEELLAGLSGKALEAKAKEANDATGILIDARNYVAQAERFIATRNWVDFAAAFGADRLKTNERGRRILKQLSGTGTQAPVPA